MGEARGYRWNGSRAAAIFTRLYRGYDDELPQRSRYGSHVS